MNNVSPLRLRRTPGFSLLEVMLSLAILGIALAMVGELVRLATRNAASAQQLVKAQLIAESILSQLKTGILPVETAFEAPAENETEWVYSVNVEPASQPDLVSVNVMVSHTGTDKSISFTLQQWLPDPNISLRAEDDSPENAATAQSGEAKE